MTTDFVQAPILETKRLRLRPHRRDDFEAFAALWADPIVVEHISGTPSPRDASWARLMRGMGMWAMLGYGYWVVENKETQSFLGEVGLADFLRPLKPSIAGIPEAGWVLTPKAHGKGLATEAMRAVFGWADTHLSESRTVCILDPDYHASRNLAQKLGFQDVTLTTYMDRPTLLMERIARS